MSSLVRIPGASLAFAASIAIGAISLRQASAQSESSSRREIIVQSAPAVLDLSRSSISELLALEPADPNDREAVLRTSAAKQTELTRRAESHTMSDADWRAALRAFNVVHTRSRWPAGEPLMLWIHEPAWLVHSSIHVRAIEPALGAVFADNLRPSWCGNAEWDQRQRKRSLALERLPANASSVVFEITIDHLPRTESAESLARVDRLWKGTLEIPVCAVERLDDVLPASFDPAVTRAVRESVHAWWSKSGMELCIGVGAPFDRFPALRDSGVSLRVELCRAGVVMKQEQLVVSGIVDWSGQVLEARGYAMLTRLPEELTAHRVQLRGWVLRMTGTPDHLLTMWEANRWWNGSIDVPLEVAFASNESK